MSIKKVRKLDLACGQNPREGFEGVDIWPKAKHVVDLQKFPWPFKTSSIDEAHCSHYCEHIPTEYVDQYGNATKPADGKDALFAFFDELYRVLKPNAWATIIVPNARSNRGFQDPTHRRFFVAEMFFYLSAEWRKLQQLDHYNVTCDFQGTTSPDGKTAPPDVSASIPPEFNAWSDDAKARRFVHEWNVIIDWNVRLRAVK